MRRLIVAALAVLSMAGATLATPVVDYFNYGSTGGSLSSFGTAGGGWAGAWSSGSIYYQPTTNLTYTATGYSSADNLASTGSVGNGAGGATQYASVRSLSTRLSGTFWVSAIVSYDGANTMYLYLDRPDTGGTNDTRIGLASGKASVRFSGGDGSGTKTFAAGTHLLLARLTVNTGNDTLDFWVDPNLSSGEAGLPAADISRSGSDAFGNDFSGVGVAGTSANSLDAIRIGTFSEVVSGGAPTQPAIQLAPTTLTFTGMATTPNPAAQSVTVQNAGVGSLNWTAAVRAPAPAWISLANTTGTNGGSFSVSVNWQGMTAGTYTAYVDVSDPAASNSPQTVTVTMTLQPPQPAISLSSPSLSFTGHAADPLPAAQAVTVQNSGTGSLNWTAAVRAPAPTWISLANTTGTDSGSFSVSANWQGMSAGTYSAYVDVTDPAASNSPRTVTVNMTVQPPPQATLRLVPSSLQFAARASDPDPAPQTVTVQNTGTAPSQWTAAVRAPAPAWISLANTSGTDNGTFSVSVSRQGLSVGTYTAYVDVSDPAASNPVQTVTVTLLARSDADAGTHSFTNTTRGTHPSTLTASSSSVTVDLSSLPAGTQVFRAILVPHVSGNGGWYPNATRTDSPLKIQSADAPGVWLQAFGPRYLTLDCTAAAQRAVAGSKTLQLSIISWPQWYSGQEVRLDVWCDAPLTGGVQQVTNVSTVHRSGDTMISFMEVNPPVTNPAPLGSALNSAKAAMDSPNEIRYRIYRSSSPIDATTVLAAELVDEISPMSGWNWTFTPLNWDAATIPTLPTADLTPSPVGTGIYVRRAQASQSAYYAVSRTVDGQEDLSTWTPGQNCTAAAVAESVGTGMVLEWKTTTPSSFQFVSNSTLHYYVKWECPPNYNVPNYVHNYLVAVPSNLVSPCPVDVALHCWGGNFESGYGWWYEAEHGGLLVASNEIPYDWWTAFHENYGTIKPFTNVEGNAGGVCRNYTQKRVWSFVNDFVANRWTIDRNHIILSGVSMGGSGAGMWGLRAGEKFCYIDSWVGIHIPRGTSTGFINSYSGWWGPDTWACLFENTGLNVWDYWDDNQWLRSHVATDTPFITAANGKNDASIGWLQAWTFAKALQETRRPHIFKWGQNGHGERAVLPGTLSDRYIDMDIDLNKALPAYTYCSLDNNPGNGDPADGDASGMLNGYLLWQPQDSTDTPARWEMTSLLVSAAPQATCTVDITPRRCQAFAPRTSMYCEWTNRDIATGAVIQSGTVQVDANGLVNVPQATVKKTKTRLAITIVGDVEPDGSVDVVDLLYFVDAFGSAPGDGNYNPACDLNHDDSVDVVDLLMLVDNFGK